MKLADGPFKDNGNNDNPPLENGQSTDMSNYKGGPNPFTDKLDYNNPAHSRENVDFSDPKRMNHAYDRHADKCFGMKESRNKQTLQTFKQKNQDYITFTETESWFLSSHD